MPLNPLTPDHLRSINSGSAQVVDTDALIVTVPNWKPALVSSLRTTTITALLVSMMYTRSVLKPVLSKLPTSTMVAITASLETVYPLREIVMVALAMGFPFATSKFYYPALAAMALVAFAPVPILYQHLSRCFRVPAYRRVGALLAGWCAVTPAICGIGAAVAACQTGSTNVVNRQHSWRSFSLSEFLGGFAQMLR